jgi:uncharacterized membrane protein YeaQ/YmgE (transglycosylase-associated protein family)
MLWFLIVGLISGWLAGLVSRGRGFGLWGDLVTGVMGAFVGGFLFNLIGISIYGMIGSIVVATIGAIIFLWILRRFAGEKTTI